MLFVHKAKAGGTTFGAYAAGDLFRMGSGWMTIPGFYFTNAEGRKATSAAYVFDKNVSPQPRRRNRAVQ